MGDTTHDLWFVCLLPPCFWYSLRRCSLFQLCFSPLSELHSETHINVSFNGSFLLPYLIFFPALAVILLLPFVPLFKKWPKPCNNCCSLRHQEEPGLFRKTADPMRTPELHLRRLSWHQVRSVLTTYCCCELKYPDSSRQDLSLSTTFEPKSLLSIKVN